MAEEVGPKRQYPVKGAAKKPTKKAIKEGLVTDPEDQSKTSAETPDPNVTSVGDTAPTGGSAATRTTRTTRTTATGGTATTSGTTT